MTWKFAMMPNGGHLEFHESAKIKRKEIKTTNKQNKMSTISWKRKKVLKKVMFLYVKMEFKNDLSTTVCHSNIELNKL